MDVDFLRGATAMAYFAIALCFSRFWKQTNDRLFGYFTAAFLVLMTGEIALWFSGMNADWMPIPYLIRLTGFLIILAAIVDKNFGGAGSPK